ncbi:serine integrase [Gordonia phage Phlop]|uniref:Serine integrase n=4 Tax=Wizardvirus TaxID=2169658 RepID=A0A890UWF5_9CAUD|nr:recombinase family protein [Gordonia phage SmokingBunny]YP_010102200.1 recombinase family protein [Gordonia phage Barb]YP_010103649.1 recombinase family protein [Gordonia phage Nubi]YP_010114963.1 recombinase family protein [Gordonia phage Phlop]QXO14426.1 serine integrase [Gordonia phage Fugax]QZD98794.1 serine integrase [Gordonia phage PinkCoffee]UVK63756.1 serine integrase [Gordonia phage PullumCavea]WAA20262.1 integrase [Gordonia phage Togo]WNM73161.1 serine integrase [Gordonia phage
MSLRAYGWTNDGKIVESEADEIRSWARHVIDGGAIRPLVAELNERGVATVTGKSWAAPTITRALTAPRMVGLRERDGELEDAPIEPILDRDTWDEVVAILTDPARKKFASRKNPPTLLAGILRCGRCGRNLHATGPSYACSARYGGCGEISTSQRLADTEVTERVLIRITGDEWLTALSDARRESAETFETAIAEAENRMVHLAEVFGEGGNQQAFDAGVAKAREVAEEARGRIALLDATAALPDTVTDAEVVEWWADAPIDTRRQVIRVVVDHIDVRAKADAEPKAGVGDRMHFHWA